jgi:hypothetical protein
LRDFNEIYAAQHHAVLLHELTHGLMAAHLDVTRTITLYEDAAVLGWHMDSTPPGHRLAVHLAGMGANDYLDNGRTRQSLTDHARKHGLDYWIHDEAEYEWLDYENSDFIKAINAMIKLYDAGVNHQTAARLASRGRLKGGLLAYAADRCGLWTEFIQSTDSPFILTRDQLAQTYEVMPPDEIEDITDAIYP